MKTKILKQSQAHGCKRVMKNAVVVFAMLILSVFKTNAVDFYWVGGTGIWSDFANHWATTSGGSVFHSTIPTPTDDVFFDQNSFTGPFDTVYFNLNNAYCKSLSFSNATQNSALHLAGTGYIDVFGSLLLEGNTTVDTYFHITMHGNGGVYDVAMGAIPFGNTHLIITGTGTYNLLDTAQCMIELNGVILNSNNNYIQIVKNNGGTVNLGTSHVGGYIYGGAAAINNTANATLVVNSNNSGVLAGDNQVPQPIYFDSIIFNSSIGQILDVIFRCNYLESNSTNFNLFHTFGTDTCFAKKAVMKNICSIGNNIAIDSLVLNFSVSGTNFGSAETVIVNEDIQVNSIPGFPIRLGGKLFKASGQVCLDYLILQNSTAMGGAQFYAGNNTVNLGNNTGWIWGACTPAYYWVGGSGNWSDVSHWATTSGGTTFHTQPPTANDDVYFDANSFSASGQIVSITPSAQCKNFDAQSLGINTNFVHNNSISVSGSFLLSPNVTWSGNGSLFFKNGGGANTVSTPNNSLGGSSIFFQSQSSSWNVLTDLSTTGTINVDSGIVTFNNIVVNANELRINTLTGITDSVKVYLGASNFNLSSLYFVNTPPAGNVLIDGSNASIVVSGPNPTFTTTPAHYHYIECAGEFNSFGNGSTIVDSLIVNSANAANLIADYVKITGTPLALPCGILSNTGNPFIKKLELASQASMNIAANHLFIDTLIMSNPTGVLNFLSIDTITINHQIVSASFASNLFTIQNTGSTTYFDFAMQTPVCLDYLNLQNINAINNNSVYAGLNSNDLGGNIGWNFASCPPQPVSYYWVGGSGNWSDVSHWATSSGGTTFQTQPPTASDDVYFDANSFTTAGQAVTIDQPINWCNNFNWQNTVAGADMVTPDSLYEIRISGSLFKDASSTLSYFGTLSFQSLNVGTIVNVQDTMSAIFTFDNHLGEWNLAHELSLKGSIQLLAGGLLTNNFNITCRSFVANNMNPLRWINFGTSDITIKDFDYEQALGGQYVAYPTFIIDDLVNVAGDPTKVNFEIPDNADTTGISNPPGIFYSQVAFLGGNHNYSEISGTAPYYYGTHTVGMQGNVAFGDAVVGSISFNNMAYTYLTGENLTVDTLMFTGNTQTALLLGNTFTDSLNIGYIKCSNTTLELPRFLDIKKWDASGNCTITMFNIGGPPNNTGIINDLHVGGNFIFNGGLPYNPPHFVKCVINGNGTFNGYCEFDTLMFTAGKLYEIAAGDSIRVNNNFIATGSGGNFIGLNSSSGGTQASMLFTNGNVCTNYLNLEDINAVGTNIVAGANSINLGGNSGWQFAPCSIVSDVWPGDANYDLIVSNRDLLNLGLAFNETGPVRSSASIAYVAQPANDWSSYFQTAVNKKHADTNGDGVINDDDTTAISLNYGLTHPARLAGQQSLTSPSDPYLYLDVTPDSTNLSDTVYIETYYGTAQTPVDSVYGIAFTINYDTVLVDTNWISTQFLNSWFGQPGVDLLTLQKSIPLQGKIDLAMVRTDHLNVNGFGGPLCRTGIVIVDNVAGRMPLPFTLSDPFAITASEFELGVNLGHDTTLVDTSGTTGVHSFTYLNFNMQPNPAKDFIVLKSLPADAIIEVYNLNGGIVLKEKSIAEKNKLVDIRKLNKGIYNIRIYNESKMLIGKMVKL